MNTEFHTPFEWWMEGAYLTKINPYFFMTTEPNRMEFSPIADN